MSTSTQPLIECRFVLIALIARLEREAFAALVGGDPRFEPISCGTMQRAVERIKSTSHWCDSTPYSVLAESHSMPSVIEAIDAAHPPLSIVELRRGRDSGPEWPAWLSPPSVIDGDTSWMEVATLLLGQQHTFQESPKGAETRAPTAEQRLLGLTPRERQVLELIAQGLSVRECAAALKIAESTVDNHKSRLMKKVGVRKSTDLVRFAFRVGVAR